MQTQTKPHYCRARRFAGEQPPSMRQAIQTKYLPMTDKRPSRVKAIAEAGTVTLPWDHSLNVEGNHTAAATLLAQKFGWAGCYYGGALPGSGYCFVQAEDTSFEIVEV